MSPNQRIALFGTSADPPSIAHLEILQWLAHHFDRVAVWASDNPFKSHQTKLEHRLAMLQLAIEELKERRHLYSLEFHPELSSSRTITTLQIAKGIWQDADFTLVVGADLIPQLPRWYRVKELLQQADILVVSRSGYEISDRDVEQLREIGGRVTIADLSIPGVSSTAYRQHRDTGIVPPPVRAYIHRENLYQPASA